MTLTPQSFGAIGDGITDDHAAFVAMFAALPARGGRCVLPAAKYRLVGALPYSFIGLEAAITLEGDGQDATVLAFEGSDGLQFNYMPSTPGFNSVHLRGFSLTSDQNGGKIGVALRRAATTNGALSAYTPSEIEDVVLRGANNGGGGGTNYWEYGALVDSVSGTKIDNLHVWGGVGQGAGIAYLGHDDPVRWAVEHNLVNSAFENTNVGVEYGPHVQGLSILASNFISGTGIHSAPGGLGRAQLSVVGSQFAGTGNSIYLESAVEGVTIAENFMAPGTGGCCVRLNAQWGGSIIGNYMKPTTISNGIGVLAFGAGSPLLIGGNTVRDMLIGMWLASGSGNINVQPNAYVNTTTHVKNDAAAANTVVTQ